MRRQWFVVCGLVLNGCNSSPYGVLTIADPDGIAVDASEVAVGFSLDGLKSRQLGGKTFPLTLALVVEKERKALVWAEARRDGVAIGRGAALLTFRSGRPGQAQADLGAACETAAERSSCVRVVDEAPTHGICLGGVCGESRCGDGYVDTAAGEECEDENVVSTDACVDCRNAVCGDGFVWQDHEACDDGRQCEDGTACQSVSTCAGIGAGGCAAQSGDGCRSDCLKIEVCGDLELDVGEECDDGNVNPNDACDACLTPVWQASLVLGLGPSGGDPSAIDLATPWDVAVDAVGNVYAADTEHHQVWRCDLAGACFVIAGSGVAGSSGDGGPATDAHLNMPVGLATDSQGNLFIADYGNHRVRRVCLDGVNCTTQGRIDTVAGTGLGGLAGENGPAVAAALAFPRAVAVDENGNVFIADSGNHCVRRVCASGPCTIGTIAAVAGICGSEGDGGENIAATAARLSRPSGVAIAAAGHILIADTGNHRIRKVCADDGAGCTSGRVYTLAGDGTPGLVDGAAGSSRLRSPHGVVIDALGSIYFADADNHRLRSIVASQVSTVAGTDQGYSGDGQTATAAQLSFPSGVAVDAGGTLFVADTGNHRIRTVFGGSIYPLIGSGVAGPAVDVEPPTGIDLRRPYDVATDAAGNLYFSETDRNMVSKLCLDGLGCAVGEVRTVAGAGGAGSAGDGGPATAATFSDPSGLAIDHATGWIYVADSACHRIRRFIPGGVIEAVVGAADCTPGYVDGPVAAALLRRPDGLMLNAAGVLYFSDRANHALRKLDGGVVSTVAGSGSTATFGYNGDNRLAVGAWLNLPRGVVLDAQGNLLVAETNNHRVRKICLVPASGCTAGWIYTVAGTGAYGYLGDGGPAVGAELANPVGLAAVADGSFYLTDADVHVVRRVDPAGVIHGFAGTSEWGFAGDGGPAIAARIQAPTGIAIAPDGNFYVAERQGHRLRKICNAASCSTQGTITTVAGPSVLLSPDGGDALSTPLTAPLSIAVGVEGIFFADNDYSRIRRICTNPAAGCAVGTIDTVAGTGVSGFNGDGPALETMFDYPGGVFIDPSGNVILADSNNHLLRRICLVTSPDCPVAGHVVTVAGTGEEGYDNDIPPIPATTARLAFPRGVAIDNGGNLYLADGDGHRIRRVCMESNCGNGTITTIAGTGVWGFDVDIPPIAALSARLASPRGLVVDARRNVYVADSDNQRIRKICGDVAGCGANLGTITTVAGDGYAGLRDDRSALAARFFNPRGLDLDARGNLLIVDMDNHRIRRLCLAGGSGCTLGNVDTVAGTVVGLSGDGGPATAARLWEPHGIASDPAGGFYVADTGNDRIRRVCGGGTDCVLNTIVTVAGDVRPRGDGPFERAVLGRPQALTWINDDSLLIADGGTGLLRRADLTAGELTSVVGYPSGWDSGAAPYFRLLRNPGGIAQVSSGRMIVSERDGHTLTVVNNIAAVDYRTWNAALYAGGLGTSGDATGALATARFANPAGLAYDSDQRILYIADAANHAIRRIDLSLSTPVVETLIGDPPNSGQASDGVCAAVGQALDTPSALAVLPGSALYVAELGNNRIRRISFNADPGRCPFGVIDTVTGAGSSGDIDDGLAADFGVNAPGGLAVDSHGNLAFTSRYAVRLIWAGEDGVAAGDDWVTTIFGGDRDVFPASMSYCLSGLVFGADEPRQLYALDSCQGFLIRLEH